MITVQRRTPQGVRGLKSTWTHALRRKRRRTPQGVRGLKSHIQICRLPCRCRTPQGVRGLKFLRVRSGHVGGYVAPRKGCVD